MILSSTGRDAGWRLATRLAVAAITLLGFAARIHRLGEKSLWLDEGLSISFADHLLPQMLSVLIYQDIHPPLYYLGLHAWMAIAGQSEFAVRFFSLLSGVLLIPAAYALGVAVVAGPKESERAGTLVGVLGAAFVASSPFLVYYSQETRMYSLMALLALLSSLLFWRGLRVDRFGTDPVDLEQGNARPIGASGVGWYWVSYVVITSLGMYLQYLFGLVLAFQAAYLASFLWRKPRLSLRWYAAMIAVALLYLPWVPSLLLQVQRLIIHPDYWQGELSFSFLIEKVFTALALGRSGFAAEHLSVLIVSALILVFGLLFLAREGLLGGRGELFMLLYLTVPLLVLYAIVARNPKFAERYLIVIAPAFYLIFARGLIALGSVARNGGWLTTLVRWPARSIALAGALLVLGLSVAELPRVYGGPGYEKDDFRSAVAYIEAHEQPGDIVILMMNTDHVFKYYYQGSLPWHGMHPGDHFAGGAHRLNELLPGHQRLWLLLWQEYWADPASFVRDSLAQAYQQVEVPGYYQGLKLQLYILDRPVKFTADHKPGIPLQVNFDNRLLVVGSDVPEVARPGEPAGVTLYWRALEPLDRDYIASLRLRRGSHDWAGHDQRPSAFTYPTPMWKVGRTVRGEIPIEIPIGTPPGEYDLALVVYPYETLRELDVIDGDGRVIAPVAQVGTLKVDRPESPSDPSLMTIPRRLDHLLSDDLLLLGFELGVDSVLPGDPFFLTVYWQAVDDIEEDYLIVVEFIDAIGERFLLRVDRPVDGEYSTDSWESGDLVVDRYVLTIPSDAMAGQGDIQISVSGGYDRSVLDRDEPVSLSTLMLEARSHKAEPPTSVQFETDYRVGDLGRLIGYDVPVEQVRAGGVVPLTLYWEALGNTDISYVVFAQLLDDESRIWGQQDNPPVDGTRPTTGWIAGEYIADKYRLPVRDAAPAGDMVVQVGMYEPQSGQRLPIYDPEGNPVGDRLLLRKVQVTR